jgi:ABC-type transporter MlaC component
MVSMCPTRFVVLCALSAAVVQARGQETRTPLDVVRTTITAVMDAVHADPAARAGDPERTYVLVRQVFLPATDFMLTTRYAVGPAWAQATPAQREALFREFETLLTRTYALQLTQAQGEGTRFRYAPAPTPAPGTTDAVVRTTVTSGGEDMAIGYRLRRTDAGWKIYDIDMMGAWLIQLYRQQFAARLATGGIDGLIRYLAAHNRPP